MRDVLPSAGTIEPWQRMAATIVNRLNRYARGKTVKVTANYTIEDDVAVIINNKSGSALTLTLPPASSFPRRRIRVKTLQAQNTVSAASDVKPIGSDTAGTAIIANTIGLWCDLDSDGDYWVVTAT